MVVNDVVVLFFCQQVEHLRTEQRIALAVFLASQNTGLDDDIALVVDDSVKLLGGQAQQIAYLVRQGTEVPNVSHRYNEFDVTSALTANFLLSHLNTTTVADNALVTDALVLTTGTLVVLGRTEDALAEQTVALGLVGTIVDGLRLCHLTK